MVCCCSRAPLSVTGDLGMPPQCRVTDTSQELDKCLMDKCGREGNNREETFSGQLGYKPRVGG